MKPIRSLVVLVAVFAGAAAIHAQTTPALPASAKAAAPARAKSTMPLVEGEVRKLDATTGLIVLKHGDIPNLGMPAMTMGFQVADRKMLAGYKPGDQVRFQAEMIKDTATVTELERR
jgi:Cu/Ag efflux protein CusF